MKGSYSEQDWGWSKKEKLGHETLALRVFVVVAREIALVVVHYKNQIVEIVALVSDALSSLEAYPD